MTKEKYIPKPIKKRLKKIYKLATYIEMVCTGVGSLTPIKDSVTEIQKISKQTLEGKK